MTAQVIFLNRWLDCPDEKKREHQLIQDLINSQKAQYYNETMNYTPFQKAVSRQKTANLFRARMVLIKTLQGQDSEDIT
jgi:hypothetical protein